VIDGYRGLTQDEQLIEHLRTWVAARRRLTRARAGSRLPTADLVGDEMVAGAQLIDLAAELGLVPDWRDEDGNDEESVPRD